METRDINSPEQLTYLKKGERISIDGLVKSMTRTEIKPSLPKEFVIQNKNRIIETLKEITKEDFARTIYEINKNDLVNLNIIHYNKIKPLYSHYKLILENLKTESSTKF